MMEIDKLDSEVQVKLEVPEDFNPWNVTDASEFLKYHCPECPYQDSQLDGFSNHALQNHERSKVLFGTSVIKCDTTEPVDEPVTKSLKPEEIKVDYGDTVEFIEPSEFIEEDEEDEICKELKCNECNKFYASLAKLNKHIYSCHKPKPVKIPVTLTILIRCDMCDQTFDDEKESRIHCKKVHNGESKMKFQCDKCDKTLATRKNLEEHVQSHLRSEAAEIVTKEPTKVENKTYICELCGFETKTKPGLSKHMARIHIEAPLQICSTCGWSTTSLPKFKHHERVAHKKGKYPCGYCDKDFNNNVQLEIHIDRKHSDSAEKNFSCDHCHKSFIYERSLKHHRFNCTKQDYVKKKNALNREKKRTGEHLVRKYAKHKEPNRERKIENTPMPPTKCDYCDHVFTERTNIKSHFKMNHAGQKIILDGLDKFQCDMCGEIYFTETRLKLHYECTHGIHEYKNTCDRCGRGYSKKHKCVYDEFKCDMCDTTTTTKTSLNRHKVIVHGQDKVSCDICHKNFKAQFQLDRHIKLSHSNNVMCDICHRSIMNPYELKKHKALVHKIEGFFCTTCPKKRVFTVEEKYRKHMKDEHNFNL